MTYSASASSLAMNCRLGLPPNSHSHITESLPGGAVHAPHSSARVGLPHSAEVSAHVKGTKSGSSGWRTHSTYMGYACITATSVSAKTSLIRSPFSAAKLSTCRPQVIG